MQADSVVDFDQRPTSGSSTGQCFGARSADGFALLYCVQVFSYHNIILGAEMVSNSSMPVALVGISLSLHFVSSVLFYCLCIFLRCSKIVMV